MKVLDIKGSESEAKAKCSQLDKTSTLITIGSLNEQKFIEKLVQKHNTLSDRVWIGLEWNDNTFKWMDGSDVSYENWDENAVKNGNNKCVQMSISNSNLGKWTDDECTRKYLIACQKKQVNNNDLEKDLNNHTKIIESQQSRLNSLEVKFEQHKIEENRIIENQQSQLTRIDQTSQIPIGFLYTQLPEQSSPQQLWPSLQWTEVTQQYAGLFFRAKGGESLPFGQTQTSNQSWISDINFYNVHFYSFDTKPHYEGWTYNRIKQGDWTNLQHIQGPLTAAFNEFNIYTTDGEVRPKNTAIKIWKRIK